MVVMFQSCTANFVTTIEESDDTSGYAGIVFGVIILCAGVTGLATLNNKPGTIVAGILYVIAGIYAVEQVGIYADLQVWAYLSIVFGAVYLLSIIGMKNKAASQPQLSTDDYTPRFQSIPIVDMPQQSPEQPEASVKSSTTIPSTGMNIMPLHADAALRKNWVTRILRIIALFINVSSILAGIGFGYYYAGEAVKAQGNILAIAVSIIAGSALGFIAGIIVSLIFWGLAMAIDDLHALRIYASGYYAIGESKKD
jgi:hypothetical protein